MCMRKPILAATAAALLSGNALATQPMPGSAPGVTRTDLQRTTSASPAARPSRARIDIAPGVTAPWHTHPGEDIRCPVDPLQHKFQVELQLQFADDDDWRGPAAESQQITAANLGARQDNPAQKRYQMRLSSLEQ